VTLNKTFHFIEITDRPWAQRWDVAKKLLGEAGVELNAEICEASKDNFESILKEKLASSAQLILFGPGFHSLAVKCLAQSTQMALLSGICSCLVKEKDGWWPRDYIAESMVRAISYEIKELDISSRALVAGVGGLGRFVVEALVKLGFEGITLTDQDVELGKESLEQLKRSMFQVDFRFISHQHITTLAGVHSIAINTTPLVLENELLDELYFFNFLKSGGVVADLILTPPETPLIDEAKLWGARFLSHPKLHPNCVVEYL
jgi:shikimate 5-dehydrogenase